MAKTDFLFVNKDSTSASLSRSSAAEKASINKHVQRTRRQGRYDALGQNITTGPRFGFAFRRKSEAQQAVQPENYESSASNVAILSSEAESDGSNSADSSTNAQKAWRKGPRNRRSSVHNLLVEDHSRESEGWKQAALIDPRETERQQQQLLHILNPLGGSVEPFGIQCIKLDSQACTLLRYYLDISQPQRWQVKGKKTIADDSSYEQRSLELVRACFQDEMTAYATLGMCAGVRINQEGAPLEETASFYIHKAIIATRAHVSKAPAINGAMIMNIYHLSCAEWFAFKSDAAFVHLKLVKTLVDQVGGWQTLNPVMKELIVLGDGFFATEKLTLPVFPCDFDPGYDNAIVEWMRANAAHYDLGDALLDPSHADIVPEKLRVVVIDLVDSVSVLIAYGEKPDAPEGIPQWLRLRNLAIRHRLLSIASFDRRTAVLRLVLCMWVILGLFRSGFRMLRTVMAPRLLEYIACIDRACWYGHEDLMKWSMLVGAMSSVVNSKTEDWFVEMLVEQTTNGGSTTAGESLTEDDLVTMCKGFFYLENAQRPGLKQVMRALERRAEKKRWS